MGTSWVMVLKIKLSCWMMWFRSSASRMQGELFSTSSQPAALQPPSHREVVLSREGPKGRTVSPSVSRRATVLEAFSLTRSGALCMLQPGKSLQAVFVQHNMIRCYCPAITYQRLCIPRCLRDEAVLIAAPEHSACGPAMSKVPYKACRGEHTRTLRQTRSCFAIYTPLLPMIA